MRLKNATITNFRSIGSISLALDSPGLHLVLGSNLDNKSFDSNGSGKSALFEAVIWGLFGEFLRSGESVDNIIRKGEKSCAVELVVDPEDGSGDVVINRSRSSKKGLLTVTRASDGGALFPAGNVNEKIQANNQLTSALSRLLLVVERYPDLKANTNFIRLQDELAGTENRIAVERRRYNETVKLYNIKIRRFPTNIIAGMFGFEKADFFEVPKERQEVPKVKFTKE